MMVIKIKKFLRMFQLLNKNKIVLYIMYNSSENLALSYNFLNSKS